MLSDQLNQYNWALAVLKQVGSSNNWMSSKPPLYEKTQSSNKIKFIEINDENVWANEQASQIEAFHVFKLTDFTRGGGGGVKSTR